MFTFVTSCCSPHISTSQQKSSTECLIWCRSGCVRILPFDTLRGLCHSTVSLGCRVNQQAQGPKTPRPIRIEQCFPTGVVHTWYALGTQCVRSDGYGASTELVRSGYGAARSIFLRSPYTPQNTF